MGKTVVFLAQSQYSPPVADQQAHCVAVGDEVIIAGDVRFADLIKATVRNSKTLKAGDHLKLYDLNSLILATGSLVRFLSKLLKAGVTIEICSEKLVIRPDDNDQTFRFLALLDKQQRAVHAVRTHGPDVKAGRKHVLKDEQWPTIKALLADRKNHTLGSVATHYGVGRTTLFNYQKRMEALEDSEKQIVD